MDRGPIRMPRLWIVSLVIPRRSCSNRRPESGARSASSMQLDAGEARSGGPAGFPASPEHPEKPHTVTLSKSATVSSSNDTVK